MDSTTSSTSTTTTASSSSLIEFNLASNLPIKMCSTNYPSWHKQILHLLKANDLEGYVTGTTPCPPAKVGQGDAAVTNPAYLHWCRQDVSLALMASCSPEAHIIMPSASSSADAWNKLHKAFANRSRARVMSLKERLASISKGTSSVHDYLRSIKSILDELALIGHPIDDIDLVIATLNGLDSSFREFCASIRTRDSPLPFNELFDKLVDFEIFLQRDTRNNVAATPTATPVTANYTHKGSNLSSNQHNRRMFNPSSSNRRPGDSSAFTKGQNLLESLNKRNSGI